MYYCLGLLVAHGYWREPHPDFTILAKFYEFKSLSINIAKLSDLAAKVKPPGDYPSGAPMADPDSLWWTEKMSSKASWPMLDVSHVQMYMYCTTLIMSGWLLI